MKTAEIAQRYLDYFEKHDHLIVPSAPLVPPAGDATLQRDLAYLQTFINGVRGAASNFGINLTVLQNRQQFAKDAILTLNVGADGLTLSDQNEEGAKLLALQTRQQLSTQALSLANQADQAVLRLFG